MSALTIPAFECAICLETCVEPVTALCGQHNFCRDHLIEYIRASQPRPNCPSCRRPIQTRPEQVFVNVGIQNAIDALQLSAEATRAVPRIPFEQLTFECKRGRWVELGRGAVGTVYSATFLDEPVAVKCIPLPPNNAAAVAKIRERIRLEVGLQYDLRHDGIVALHGESEELGDDGVPEAVYIVMQRMCKTLKTWAEETSPVPSVRDKLLRLREVLKALRFLHARGIVHGDIKPTNIMIDESGAARLCDFGSARLRRDEDAAVALSRSMGLATPLYLDPAVFAQERSRRKASDVYSFCIMAWEVLSGRVPFAGRESESIEALLAHVRVEANRPDLALLPAVVPENGRSLKELKKSLARGWAGRQEDRGTAADILSTFERLLEDSAVAGEEELGGGRAVPPQVPAGIGKLIFDASCTATNEDHAQLQTLLAERPNDVVLNSRDAETGMTPLMQAISNKNFLVVKLLVDTPGVDVNKSDRLGNTPLGLAILENTQQSVLRRDICAILKAAGAEISKREAGKSIYYASLHGDVEMLRGLLARWGHNAEVLNWADDSKERNTALIAALSAYAPSEVHSSYDCEEAVDVVRLLVAVPGIDVNKPNANGETAMFQAVKYCVIQNSYSKMDESLDALLSKGASVNKENNQGSTPLGMAMSQCRTSLCSKLRSVGAKCTRKEASVGILALSWKGENEELGHMLAMWGRDATVLNLPYEPQEQLVVESPFNDGAVDLRGCTAIICATIRKNVVAVRMLLATGLINVNYKCPRCWSALT